MFSNRNKTTKSQQHIIDRISLSIIRIIIGVLIGLQVVVPMVVAYSNIIREHTSFKQVPDDYNLDYEQISLDSSDGVKVSGWYIPFESIDPAPGIILIHGLGTNRADVLDIANTLHEDGYATFLFDLRGHGLSDTTKATFGIADIKDIEAAVKFMASRKDVDETKIGFYAISYGAALTIQALGQDDLVQKYTKAVFLDSPYSDLNKLTEERFPWHRGFITPLAAYISRVTAQMILGDDPFKNQPIDVIKNLEMPLYLVHGAEDRTIDKSHSIALNQVKKFGYNFIWIAPLCDHLAAKDEYPSEYEEKLLTFFEKYIKEN